MNGNQDRHLRCDMDRRGYLFSLLFFISLILNPFGREARSNEMSGLSLSRIYTGNFSEDILRKGRSSFIGWNVGHKPLHLKRPGKGAEPAPLTKQYLDLSKRKGISAKAPEPAAPAFTGFFPGYPPENKCGAIQLTFPLSSPDICNNSRIRPPPVS